MVSGLHSLIISGFSGLQQFQVFKASWFQGFCVFIVFGFPGPRVFIISGVEGFRVSGLHGGIYPHPYMNMGNECPGHAVARRKGHLRPFFAKRQIPACWCTPDAQSLGSMFECRFPARNRQPKGLEAQSPNPHNTRNPNTPRPPVQGAGCRVQGAGCRVWEVGCRVS